MTTHEVARITGASMRRLQYWDERGIIRVQRDKRNSGGSGYAREYTETQAMEAAIIVALRRFHLPFHRVMRSLKQYRRRWREDGRLSQMVYLLTDGQCTWFEHEPLSALRAITGADAPVAVVDLGAIATRILGGKAA